MKRYGNIIKINTEKLEEYKKLHANPWPEILHKIKDCNIQNYSIFYRDGYLFSYYEYIGTNFEADMQKMRDDSNTQRWWRLCEPCQVPLDTAQKEEWWVDMEEVFHLD